MKLIIEEPSHDIDIETLFLKMSKARSDRYLNAAKSHSKALKLYQLNGQIGAMFWVPLQHFEIVLRNTIDRILCLGFSGEWIGNIAFHRLLKKHRRDDLEKSIKKYTNNQTKEINRNKVVADLSFSFWEDMLLPKFIPIIWQQHLDQAVPHRKEQDVGVFISSLHQQTKRVRNLRNRIAHHEPIFPRKLNLDWAAVMEPIKSFSEEFYKLIIVYQQPIKDAVKELDQLLNQESLGW